MLEGPVLRALGVLLLLLGGLVPAEGRLGGLLSHAALCLQLLGKLCDAV